MRSLKNSTRVRSRRVPASTEPGFLKPVKAGGEGLSVRAWLNTDNSRGRPSYHLVIKARGHAEHDLFALTPARIKELGESLLELHDLLTRDAKR